MSFCDHSLPKGLSRLFEGPKLAPAIRPAKVVPMSMADDESAEPLLEGSTMSRERPTSGMAERESKAAGS